MLVLQMLTFNFHLKSSFFNQQNAFPKMYFLERVKPCFLVTFDITISYIFSKNFVEIYQVV